MSNALDGNTTSIAFATSGFAGNIISIDGPSISRESIDCSHLGTAKAMEFFPANLADAGELSLEVEADPDTSPMIADAGAANAPTEVITITWPLPAGMATPATWAFSGFVTSFSIGAANGERMTSSMGIKITGPVTIVAAA